MQLIRILYRSTALSLICFSFAQARAEDVKEEDIARFLRSHPESGPLLNEIRRFEMERKNFNARCEGYRQGSEYLQCQQERARLESWESSLMSRFKAVQQADSVRQHSQTSPQHSPARTNRLQQADSVRQHSQAGAAATKTGDLEAASWEARHGFDTPVTRKGSIDSSVVDARGLSKQVDRPPEVPPRFKNHPTILNLEKQRMAAVTEKRKAEAELKEITEALKKPGTNKGALEVRQVRASEKVTQAAQKEAVARIKEEDEGRKLSFSEPEIPTTSQRK